MRDSSLVIAIVYPDLLGTYGDGGNGIVLKQRALWRGIEAELLEVCSNEALPKADIYCLGGGEDGPQVKAAQTLIKDKAFNSSVGSGAVVLAVCAGYQIIGNSFPGADGAIHQGLGLLNVVTTKGKSHRAVGEVRAEPFHLQDNLATLPTLTGFENHAGVTELCSGTHPMARVIYGTGNGGGDFTEGAHTNNIFGTYLHGPVLARNPALSDIILALALGSNKELAPLDDTLENALRAERLSSNSLKGHYWRQGIVPGAFDGARLVRARLTKFGNRVSSRSEFF